MKQKIIAGNWKMNTNLHSASALVNTIISGIEAVKSKVVFIPPFPLINPVHSLIDNKENVLVGAQDISSHEKGAYTGEVNGAMLTSVGARFVLVGHSERREYFHEDDNLLLEKINRSLENHLRVIFCCGEPLAIREAEQHFSYVTRQIENVLGKLPGEVMEFISVAYEPIWAIGTGRTATPDQAQEMHSVIRNTISKLFSEQIAHRTSILYGGSLKASNAEALFDQPDIDGGLIGGASLIAEEFISIIQTMENK